MVGRQAGLFKRHHGDGRIPHRRHAGLQPQSLFVFNFKSRELADLARGEGIIGR